MNPIKLEELLPRPAHAREIPDGNGWNTVEQQLGTELPKDYKRFVESFGTGVINGFLVVLNPFSSNQHVNLLSRTRVEQEAYITLKGEFPDYYTDEIYPHPGGLLPFAVTDNGEVLYWSTAGRPDEWSVVVYESRGPDHCRFAGRMTEFLAGVLTGAVECRVLPKSLSKRRPSFD